MGPNYSSWSAGDYPEPIKPPHTLRKLSNFFLRDETFLPQFSVVPVSLSIWKIFFFGGGGQPTVVCQPIFYRAFLSNFVFFSEPVIWGKECDNVKEWDIAGWTFPAALHPSLHRTSCCGCSTGTWTPSRPTASTSTAWPGCAGGPKIGIRIQHRINPESKCNLSRKSIIQVSVTHSD